MNTFRPTNAGTDGSNAVHNRTLYFPSRGTVRTLTVLLEDAGKMRDGMGIRGKFSLLRLELWRLTTSGSALAYRQEVIKPLIDVVDG